MHRNRVCDAKKSQIKVVHAHENRPIILISIHMAHERHRGNQISLNWICWHIILVVILHILKTVNKPHSHSSPPQTFSRLQVLPKLLHVEHSTNRGSNLLTNQWSHLLYFQRMVGIRYLCLFCCLSIYMNVRAQYSMLGLLTYESNISLCGRVRAHNPCASVYWYINCASNIDVETQLCE